LAKLIYFRAEVPQGRFFLPTGFLFSKLSMLLIFGNDFCINYELLITMSSQVKSDSKLEKTVFETVMSNPMRGLHCF